MRLPIRPGAGGGGGGGGPLLAHTIVQSPNGDNSTTPAIDTTGATLIVVALSWYVPFGARGVSDSNGNTWTGLTTEAGAVVASRLFYVASPTVGGGHTFSVTGAGAAYGAMTVLAFSTFTGVNDLDVGATTTSGSTIQPGSGTPAHNNELIVTGAATGVADTFSIDSGFTITDQAPLVSNQSMGIGAAYLVQTAAAAVNPTWTGSAGSSGRSCAMGSWQ